MESRLKVTSIEGNGQWLDGGAMFGNAPKALWSRWCEPDEQGRVRLSCRSLLVEYEDKKILCEVGIGAYMDPKLSERFGVESDKHLLLEGLLWVAHRVYLRFFPLLLYLFGSMKK